MPHSCSYPGFSEKGRFLLDTDASLFAVRGVLNQLQDDREVVIAYASRSLHLSQRRYCTTRRDMLAAVVMCTHFRSYLRGAQFTVRTDHSSLRWLQKFRNEDGMLARWYLLLEQFSVTFEYRPGAQHANADGMCRQCDQCQRPDCPVSASDSQVADRDVPQALEEQPFASSEMGESMDTELLPELLGETWVVSTLFDGLMADLLPVGADMDLIVASRQDRTLATVREWVQSGNVPLCADCAGLSPELRCWRLQVGNLSIDMDGRLWRRRTPPSGASQLVVPLSERRDMIGRFHDSLFAGHLGVSRTVFRLQSHGTCYSESSMGSSGDLLDLLVTSAKGNRYVLVMVDCFSRWTEACPLPDKTALSVVDTFFQYFVCRFGMPSVIHSDQGREFENKVMQELCLLCGAHKTRTAPYHPESDGLVERFNRTLFMMLAMFAGENKEDWDDLLPAVMMAYRSSVHESTGFSPYRLMLREVCITDGHWIATTGSGAARCGF